MKALERVGLSPVELFLTKYPRDLSGGQKQRVVIARAIVLEPRAAGRRRAGLDARHERARQDPAADARPQARPRAHLRLHHPRPGDREVLLRPDRDHVPRPDRRDRPDRGDLRPPAPPLHQGAAGGDPGARPRQDGAARPAARRDPGRRRAAPRAARSTRGAPRPRRPAGGSRATCGPSSRSTGRAPTRRTTRSGGCSATSTHLDTPSTTATIGTRRQRRGRAGRSSTGSGPRTPTSRCGRG